MSMKIKASVMKNLLHIGIFLALFIVIIESFPKQQASFRYHFELDKPWGYGLLTAEFDFPLLKTEEQLAAEKELALKDYTPYYRLNDTVVRSQTALLTNTAEFDELNRQLQEKLRKVMEEIYAHGIVSVSEMEMITIGSCTAISIVGRDNVAERRSVSSIHTPRSAYSAIIEQLSKSEANKLKIINLNRYLVPDLEFDAELSERIRKSIEESVSRTEDMFPTASIAMCPKI